jgi:type IV pilus assembly protein PilY1
MITFHSTIKKASCLLVIAAMHISAHAVDISSEPLNTYSAASSTDVKPNLMFILDNSGSMDFAYMPDDVLEFGSSDEKYGSQYDGRYGFVSSQCNGVYYNPKTTYTAPIQADGTTSYPNASFTAALRNGYDTSSGTVDLSSDFEAINGPNYDSYRNHSGFNAQPAFYYTYQGSQTAESQKTYTDTGSTFYKECNSAINNSPGNGVFTKVIVSDKSSPKGKDERQNFANWYSYYRTRLLMMKTASGTAFKDIDSRFRVGFMTINNVDNETNDFLNIGDFDSATKTTWYDSLYGNETGGSTPLRRALADAGRMYAGVLTKRNGVTVVDPVQFSCQQNFTLLSTDGLWNGGTPYKLDGSTSLGNQDVGLSRPYYDGGSAQLQTRTSNLRQRTGHLQKRTKSGGWWSSWSNWSNVSSCDPNSSTQCQYNWGSWSNVSSCTVQQSSG